MSVPTEWTAVIGALPHFGPRLALNSDAQIGPLRLLAGPHSLYEGIAADLPTLSARNVHVWWPIAVEGRHESGDWATTVQAASRQLHRLCALLSVVTECGWTLREMPVPTWRGVDAIPPHLPYQSSDEKFLSGLGNRVDLALPGWLDDAWSRLDREGDLTMAVGAYWEGLALLWEHPSIALVAFVSSIEALGPRLHPLVQCDVCNCWKDSSKRFRKTIQSVRSGRIARELQRLYDPRSKVVHGGHRFGGEDAFGTIALRTISAPFALPEELRFSRLEVRRLQRAARDILAAALQGNFPGEHPTS